MRTVLLYLALVGVPVLGVLAILHVGRGLTPPRSVAGAWVLQARAADAAACPWAPVLRGTEPLRIEQSGERLVLTGAGGRLRGRLHEDAFRAEQPGEACEAAVLTATLLGGAVAEVLRGTFEAPGCAACPRVRFQAVRAGATEG